MWGLIFGMYVLLVILEFSSVLPAAEKKNFRYSATVSWLSIRPYHGSYSFSLEFIISRATPDDPKGERGRTRRLSRASTIWSTSPILCQLCQARMYVVCCLTWVGLVSRRVSTSRIYFIDNLPAQLAPSLGDLVTLAKHTTLQVQVVVNRRQRIV